MATGVGWFLRLPDEEVLLVFPEMLNMTSSVANKISFSLAMRAIESGGNLRRMSGLDLLFALSEDEKVASEITKHYGFFYFDLIGLSARINRFQVSMMCDLLKEIARIKSIASWCINGSPRHLSFLLSKMSVLLSSAA